ncbi:MAG TPA: signal peptidase I [Dehalococcoidia bacterium]
MSFFAPNEPDDTRSDRAADLTPVPLPVSSSAPGDVFGVYDSEVAPRRSTGSRLRGVAWEVLQTVILAAVIFFAVRSLAQNFRVEGRSMEPGLQDSQYLVVNKAVYLKLNLDTLSKYIPFIHGGDHPERFLFRSPHRGDVIVFRAPTDPTRDFIKRVIGLPGDTVEVKNGTVFVNGSALDEPYEMARPDYTYTKQTVPAGQYFVLGDNRNNSSDSHVWGFVPEDNIIGQAMFRYWPLHNLGGVGNHTLKLGFIHLPLP